MMVKTRSFSQLSMVVVLLEMHQKWYMVKMLIPNKTEPSKHRSTTITIICS